MDIGDHCFTAKGKPARYIGSGHCLYVAGDKSLRVRKIGPQADTSIDAPLPTDGEVEAAAVVIQFFKIGGM
jgi:hypothetical protein